MGKMGLQFLDLDNDLLNLCSQEKFYSVLDAFDDERMYFSKDYRDFLAVGFALCELNRQEDGFQQCALGIEMAPTLERPKALYLAGIACNSALDHEIAKKLFAEAFQSAAYFKESKIGDYGSEFLKDCHLQYRTASICEEVSEDNLKTEHASSLEEEIKNYTNSGGTLDDKPTLRNFYEVLKSNYDASTSINKKGKFSDNSERDSLTVIFRNIVELTDNDAFIVLSKNENVIQIVMADELNSYPEVDISMEPRYILKILKNILQYSEIKFMKICRTLVKITTIKSFFAGLNNKYLSACNGYKWVANFIREINSLINSSHKYRIKLDEKTTEFFSIESIIGINTLWARAYFLVEKKTSKEIQQIINVLLDNLNSEDFSNGTLFNTLGELYLNMAALNSEEIFFETTNGFRLPKDEVEELIRIEIFAMVLKNEDDFSVIDNCDKLLLALFLYGNVHIKTIWFFYFLREYYINKLQTFPLNFFKFKENENISDETLELFEQVFNIRNCLTKMESKNMWCVENGNKYLMPQGYTSSPFPNKQSSIMLLEDGFINVEEKKKFFFKKTVMKVTKKLKNPNHYHEDFLKNQLEKSRDWLVLWSDVAHNSGKKLPQALINFLSICLD